jgi:hypothetical protein
LSLVDLTLLHLDTYISFVFPFQMATPALLSVLRYSAVATGFAYGTLRLSYLQKKVEAKKAAQAPLPETKHH